MICFTIDELTPCLKNVKTGDIVETECITLKRKSFLSKFNKRTGWYVNWAGFEDGVIVKALVIKGTVDIQGLIALEDESESKAVHIKWACTSPNNNVLDYGKKDFIGVGGHLFAIAGKYSMDLGYGGFVYGEALNVDIMNYYIREFGAISFPYGENYHPYKFAVSEQVMKMIVKEYDYAEADSLADEEI